MAYNVPGIRIKLRFSPQTLVGIYLGDITRWDDLRLVADNPALASVKEDIIALHRGDGSGTTYTFSNYLDMVSSAWHNRIGKGTSIIWPQGLGVRKNDGMVRGIKQNPYSIGITELNYAIPNKLAYGLIKNRDGRFVEPSVNSIAATVAISGTSALGDLRFSLVNAPGPASSRFSPSGVPAVSRLWLSSTAYRSCPCRNLLPSCSWVSGCSASALSSCASAPDRPRPDRPWRLNHARRGRTGKRPRAHDGMACPKQQDRPYRHGPISGAERHPAFVGRALASLVVREIGYYRGHRLSHEISLPWHFPWRI